MEILVAGTGRVPKQGETVTVHYTGCFTDGRKFDRSVDRREPFAFVLGAGQVIRGWDLGVARMKVGDKVKLTLPPALAYGATVDLAATSPVYTGTRSLAVTANNSASDWQALYLHHDALYTIEFTHLSFWIHGGLTGGNATSRYNWQENASNRAQDWYFQALPESGSGAGASVDAFIQSCLDGNAVPGITVPINRWVARLGPGRQRLCSFSRRRETVQGKPRKRE